MPSLLLRYRSLVEAGRLDADPAQEAVVIRLEQLCTDIGEKRLKRKSSALGWLFGRKDGDLAHLRGLYIWGAVGRGKTMLMDLFFGFVTAQRKRRVHFHDFMADVHGRIHEWRQQARNGKVQGSDPIGPVAEALAEEAWVLCFDEFAVNDIADAMILARLFKALWQHGVVVVATSNVDPADLYKDGLNRALFLPFIDLLRQNMDVVRLEARTDYRLEKLGGNPVYMTPADAAADQALDAVWARLTGGADPKPATLTNRGRSIQVDWSAPGVARMSFEALCGRPLGASDYIALARAYHTVLLDHVPVMDFAQRNEAKRFITLIDVFYEHNIKMIISAADVPQRLYRATEGREAFEFERTISRLIEMQSDSYLARPHGRPGSLSDQGLGGIVET